MTSRAADATEKQEAAADEPTTSAAIYGQGVRETEWQTAEQERNGFHLPPGFEIRLFASEPQIAKPLNMAFDHRGRLWVTQSVEYPYPATDPATASDAVVILTDRDHDGRADDVQTFADNLNIPMGVLPYGDGCLCFSIPNLLYLRDTDGDGVCDEREVVVGPFDTTRDTHGMINALRDGGDGWIYACHGFNNQSEVGGTDGHMIRMNSGNTFRFRPDGSRVELVTQGQVNPFGMCEDEWGYRFSADCHSKPITQLIRGACYPSFGRPHDGLGFLPPMVDHLHGSTAICGIVQIPSESPWESLRGQMLSGNVMTSRLNRNRLAYQGATARGSEASDFMTSDDPWFRPVDLQFGPDGHLYVADFYNKIIGHYEVPLDHPDRDRTSGRIWQIRNTSPAASPNADRESLTARLSSPVATRRSLAASQVTSVDVDAVRELAMADDSPPFARVAAMRGLVLAAAVSVDDLLHLVRDRSPRVRVEALRQAAEVSDSPVEFHQAVVDALSDTNAHVRQAAAEWIGRRGAESDVALLQSLLRRTAPTDDPVLVQTVRIAIRDLYRNAPDDSKLWEQRLTPASASIMQGMTRREVAPLLLDYLSNHPDAPERDALLEHAAAHAGIDSLGQCVTLAKRWANDSDSRFHLLNVLADSQNANRRNAPAALKRWATELVTDDLNQFDRVKGDQTVLAWGTDEGGEWPVRERQLASGESASLVDSIGLGEAYTGKLRSDAFKPPAEIRFWLAGHNGFPKEQDHQKNSVRLVDAATGETLRVARPPRNDTAREIRWATSDLQDQLVRIECVDGDNATAYAWIAVGRFQPTWIQDFQQHRHLRRACQWIRRLGLTELRPRLEAYLNAAQLSSMPRLTMATTLAALQQRPAATVLLQTAAGGNADPALVDLVVAATVGPNAPQANDPATYREAAKVVIRSLSSTRQKAFAVDWVNAGAEPGELLEYCRRGWLSPAALADANVRQSLAPKLSEGQQETLAELTKKVDSGADRSRRLTEIRQALASATGDADRGKQVFNKHCSACHQLRGEGKVVGPQLDGAVTRGVDRLLEDIVMPDQNVDAAFRTTSFLLDDGRVVVGLIRSENADTIRVVDNTGKEIAIEVAAIEQRQDAGRSLMPNDMADAITPAQLSDLLQYIRQSPASEPSQ